MEPLILKMEGIMNYLKEKRIEAAIIKVNEKNQLIEKSLDAILQGLFCFNLSYDEKEA
jgi:hypothetical protein